MTTTRHVGSYTVITTKRKDVADDISTCLNSFGRWDTVVVPRCDGKWDVILPGDVTDNTRNYMHGFLDGWLTSSRIFLEKAKAGAKCG